MTDIQDANQRFNRLWDEIGAARVVIGAEDKGVEIVVDADLSIFNLIEKLKVAAREGQAQGELDERERKSVTDAVDQAKHLLEKNIDAPLRTRMDALLSRPWNSLHRR